jgi:hypothetical protein
MAAKDIKFRNLSSQRSQRELDKPITGGIKVESFKSFLPLHVTEKRTQLNTKRPQTQQVEKRYK